MVMQIASQDRQAGNVRQVRQPCQVDYHLPVVGGNVAEQANVSAEKDAEPGENLDITYA